MHILNAWKTHQKKEVGVNGVKIVEGHNITLEMVIIIVNQ